MFFEYSDIKPFLIATLTQKLNQESDDNTELFLKLHDEAINRIKAVCTFDETADFPGELLLPAAWIINFTYVQTFSKVDKDEFERLEKLNSYAKGMIVTFKTNKKPKIAKVGHIKDLWR